MSMPPEGARGLLGQLAAGVQLPEVTGHEHRPASGIRDVQRGRLGVLLLLRQVREGDVGTLAGKGDRHCTAGP
jgi:hypothetical protein